MAQFFDAVEARILAVVCSGRGADGSLGPDALARSIPSGRFRKPANDASVRDPAYPAAELDRAVSIEWLSVEDDPDALSNERDTRQLRQARFNLLVGYAAGIDASAYVHLASGTGETQAGAAAYPHRRALSDAERIRRALAWGPLVQGTTPEIVQCVREGATALEPIDLGRVLSITPYRVTLEVNMTTTFDP